MLVSDEETLLKLNARFYEIMRAGDFGAMELFWCRRREITCTHPGGRALAGRRAVLESWREIFRGGGTNIWPDGARAVVTGESGFVLTLERVAGVALMASNVFVREEGEWRMLNHQAGDTPVLLTD